MQYYLYTPRNHVGLNDETSSSEKSEENTSFFFFLFQSVEHIKITIPNSTSKTDEPKCKRNQWQCYNTCIWKTAGYFPVKVQKVKVTGPSFAELPRKTVSRRLPKGFQLRQGFCFSPMRFRFSGTSIKILDPPQLKVLNMTWIQSARVDGQHGNMSSYASSFKHFGFRGHRMMVMRLGYTFNMVRVLIQKMADSIVWFFFFKVPKHSLRSTNG